MGGDKETDRGNIASENKSGTRDIGKGGVQETGMKRNMQ